MKYSIVATSFLLIFLLHIPVSHAEGSATYEVGVDSLNVRLAPSIDGTIIGNLAKGDRVTVFQKSFGWVQTYYNGKEAWVASQFLIPINEKERASEFKKITVTANEVRLRSGPGIDYNILGYTSLGNTFRLIKTKHDWHKISMEDGAVAWIAGWLTNTKANTKQRNSKIEPEDSSLTGYNIVIDPGHGGKDPGAIGIDGVFEKNLIMKTASSVAEKLRQAGATVIMTRTDDYFVTLEDRVRISESYNTHAFISLHYNAYPIFAINGVSTYFYAGRKNRALAQAIQGGLMNSISLQNRGIMQNSFHVLRENSDPAVLVELGFITNAYDLATIQNKGYHDKVAAGIVNGLMKYFGG